MSEMPIEEKLSELMDQIDGAIPESEPMLVLAALEGVFLRRHVAYQTALHAMTEAATAKTTESLQ